MNFFRITKINTASINLIYSSEPPKKIPNKLKLFIGVVFSILSLIEIYFFNSIKAVWVGIIILIPWISLYIAFFLPFYSIHDIEIISVNNDSIVINKTLKGKKTINEFNKKLIYILLEDNFIQASINLIDKPTKKYIKLGEFIGYEERKKLFQWLTINAGINGRQK